MVLGIVVKIGTMAVEMVEKVSYWTSILLHEYWNNADRQGDSVYSEDEKKRARAP